MATQPIFPNLELAFDVGHSSLGWAVLQSSPSAISQTPSPTLLGCGSVIFPTNDCLASVRRGFRRQRRHIRATRLRIARLRLLLSHIGALTDAQLEAPGCAWPWLLAARVLRSGNKLTWPELWDVLRWYAHNRGYDGNKGWSRQDAAAAANAEDTEKEQKANEELAAFKARHGRDGTMAEVFCDRLGLNPLGERKASSVRFRDLGAAFPREGVEAEVERILRAHLGVLHGVDETFIEAIMRDHTKVKGPDYRLPKRYGQRVNGARTPGGLLFGQLVPRFENRIIATCPLTFQRVFERVLAESGDKERAAFEAGKLAKVPSVACPEFHRFRWAMQLANVNAATADARKPRRLTAAERKAVNGEMERHGALTPTEFKKAVRAQTGTNKDNLDRLLALPDADKSLVLDPARKLASGGALGVLWPLLGESLQKHTLTNLRRGKAVTARALLVKCPGAQSAFDKWWDGEAMKKPPKPRRNDDAVGVPRTRDDALDEKHSLPPANGRAAHSREVMREVWDFVLSTDKHPMDEGGPLFRSEAIRRAQLQRAIDEQTNNHLVRHRLRILAGETDEEAARHPKQPRFTGLFRDLVDEYAGGDKSRIARITIEVNRSVKELSGKTVQEQAKEQGQQTFHFRNVEKKLTAAYEGLGVRLGPGLIRKGRIAEDLGWTCPYSGRTFDALDLLHRHVDKDHVIPRSQRASDSLDSLVITSSSINNEKSDKTGLQFVKWMNQPENLKRRDELGVWTSAHYEAFVKALDTRGHDDDERRKKNRKRLMMLEHYVEKEFTPGDLTKTSQLVRLGAEALQRAYLDEAKKPVIVSLPGSVTGAVRKSWRLAGCLQAANPNVMNPDDLDENGRPRVHRKTELRGITHLHHALDACVLVLASHILPCDGGVWKREVLELLSKRRCNPAEQAILRYTLRGHIAFSAEGAPQLAEPEKGFRDQVRARLAELRVVQHLPASMADMVSDQTVWRCFDPADPHRNAKRLGRWLAKAGVKIPAPDAKTVIIITRKRKAAPKPGEKEESAGGKVFHEGKTWRWVFEVKAKDALLGFAPVGDPAASKLKPYKAVKVLGDNFGIALDPEPALIRPLQVWRQLKALQEKNGGKWPQVIRKGSMVRVLRAKTQKVDYRGVWMVRGLNFKQRDGFIVGLAPADFVADRRVPGVIESASLDTLLKCGLEILDPSLCGVAQAAPASAPA